MNCCTSGASVSRRSAFVTVGRDLPTLLAASSLREAVYVQQRAVAERLLNRVEVLALEVFHQRHLRGQLVVGLDHSDRHFFQSCETGGAPAALAGNDLIIAGVQLAHGYRLYDAVLGYGLSQLLQGSLVKIGAWLCLPRLNPGNWQAENFLTALALGLSEEGVKAGTKTFFC